MPTSPATESSRSRGRSRRVFSRRVAPFVPLALAALANTSVLTSGGGTSPSPPTDNQPAVCEEDIADAQTCHSQYPTGCSAAANYDGYLNYLKNLLIDPSRSPAMRLTPADLAALDGRLPDGLSKRNHEDYKDALAALGEGKVVALTGYLYYAKKGGTESSNCRLTAIEDIDFHIGIGPQADFLQKLASGQKLTAPEKREVDTQSVIVEMTPHWREQYEPDWTLELLGGGGKGSHGALGRQVRVFGQLLVDNEHADTNDDCAVEGHGERCWRASVWELHPVTRFQVCGAASCTPESDAGWVDLASAAPAAGPAAGGSEGPAPPAPAAR